MYVSAWVILLVSWTFGGRCFFIRNFLFSVYCVDSCKLMFDLLVVFP